MSTGSFSELSEAQLDALIGRVQEAVEHQLSLSVEDMQLLLKALLTLAHLQERRQSHRDPEEGCRDAERGCDVQEKPPDGRGTATVAVSVAEVAALAIRAVQRRPEVERVHRTRVAEH